MVRPLRVGWGVSARPLRKKELFLTLIFLKPLKIKYTLLKTTCRNNNKCVLTVFTAFLKNLPTNMDLLAQKLWRIFLSKSFSGYFKTKKEVPNDH